MEKKDIIKALANFQKDCPELALSSTVTVITKAGGKYSFKYAGLPYIMGIIQPELSKNGLIPLFDFPENVIRLTIYHTSGQEISSQLPIKLVDSPQENASLITYYRRYLITSLLNLTADNDDDGNTFEQNDREVEPEKWLNVHPSKTSKALTSDFILAWERINIYGEKIQNIRNDFKIAKDTVLKLNDEKLVSIISDENYTKTLDGNLDQINTVLKKFAMKKDQRKELEKIIEDATVDNLEQSGLNYDNELKNLKNG